MASKNYKLKSTLTVFFGRLFLLTLNLTLLEKFSNFVQSQIIRHALIFSQNLASICKY